MKIAARRQRRTTRRALLQLYARLYAHFGPQNWWPAESRWEVMVGAILTQNTAWANVERALAKLKRADRLAPARLRALGTARLGALVRSAGFTSSKPRRLKGLARFLLREYGDDPAKMLGGDLSAQRAQLLALEGIGPETADAILLYAADQPVFVVDAYTRRILSRMGLVAPNASYAAIQALFMQHLPHDRGLFNEYHALLDTLGKNYCYKRAPRCVECPARRQCRRIGVPP
jgi:endonuclease-3 related protein